MGSCQHAAITAGLLSDSRKQSFTASKRVSRKLKAQPQHFLYSCSVFIEILDEFPAASPHGSSEIHPCWRRCSQLVFNQQFKSLYLSPSLEISAATYPQRTNSEGLYWGENLSVLFSLAQDETFNIFLFSPEAVKMREQWQVKQKQKYKEIYYLHEVESTWVCSNIHIWGWWGHQQPLNSYMHSLYKSWGLHKGWRGSLTNTSPWLLFKDWRYGQITLVRLCCISFRSGVVGFALFVFSFWCYRDVSSGDHTPPSLHFCGILWGRR